MKKTKLTEKEKLEKEKQELEDQQIDIENFYKTFNLSNVKNKKNLKNELLAQIMKKPTEKKADMPHILPDYKNNTHQTDLLFLPNDDGFRYCLTVVDVGSRLTDGEPLKTKEAKEVVTAMKKIYARNILSKPNFLQCDNGSDFKGVFDTFCKKLNIKMMVAQTGRHRQVALVEARNKAIAEPLLMRMVAEELVTGEHSVEWTEFLPSVIKDINEKYEIEGDTQSDTVNVNQELNLQGKDALLFEDGTKVRYQLDEPISAVTNKKIDSKFRSGDVRYSPQTTEIAGVVLNPDNPPLYRLKGKTALYTRQQLQPVSDTVNLPPDTIQKKFIIEKIVGKKQ